MGNSSKSINLIENLVDLEYRQVISRSGTIKHTYAPNGNRQD